MSVEVSQLVKSYGKQHALDNISFSAAKGEILGFLGPNGAGKSTTMKITTCYIPPSSGSVKVCGYDVLNESVAVRSKIGYLPEHNPLYLDLYVHEYLNFIGSLHKLKGSELSRKRKEMIDLCGLGLEQNKKIGALSKGYRQRVGLAQALIHDPEVLILDEPTTGLDPNQLVEIRNLIKEVSKDKTVIFSTHIMQEVEALCDRVVIINRGSIVADNRVEELTRLKNSGTQIEVEFAEDVERNIFDSIANIIEIKTNGSSSFTISVSQEADIRAQIYHLAQANNLTLLELHSKKISLEEVFHQLTLSQKNA